MLDLRKKDRELNIFISAGESSGDLHGAEIVKLLKENPNLKKQKIKIWGIGLKNLKKQGVQIIQDMSNLGIIGISGLLKNLFFFLRLEKKIIKQIKETKPDLAILIDYPGLNLRLAEKIKKSLSSCKVLFYSAPQVWAWNSKRKYKMAKIIDRLYPILPFEEEIHRQAGTKTLYLGNPSCHQAYLHSKTFKRKNFLDSIKLDSRKTIIALCPGSRKRTCDFTLPVLLEAAKSIYERYSQTQFLLIRASSIEEKQLRSYFNKAEIKSDSKFIKIIDYQNNFDALASSLIVWTVSGTVSLETACLGTPMILGNLESNFQAWFFKTFIKINVPGLKNSKLIGLPNLVAGEQITPELFQEEFNITNFVEITSKWLSQPKTLEEIKEKFKEKVVKKLNPELNPAQGIVNDLKFLIPKKFY